LSGLTFLLCNRRILNSLRAQTGHALWGFYLPFSVPLVKLRKGTLKLGASTCTDIRLGSSLSFCLSTYSIGSVGCSRKWNGKLSPLLNKASRHDDVRENGGITPLFINLPY